MIIEKAILKECPLLHLSRFEPYKGDTIFIIDDSILIFEDEIIEDFDIDYYRDIFEIIETVVH